MVFQWKIDNPKRCISIMRTQTKPVAHFKTKVVHLLADFHNVITTENQYQIARICTNGLCPCCEVFL